MSHLGVAFFVYYRSQAWSYDLLWPVDICKCDASRDFRSTCTMGLALSLAAGNLSPPCKKVQASLLEDKIMSREILAIPAVPHIPAEALHGWGRPAQTRRTIYPICRPVTNNQWCFVLFGLVSSYWVLGWCYAAQPDRKRGWCHLLRSNWRSGGLEGRHS